ncbi:hypothetical protein [Brachymonas denitrificans]|jgi:hypothetical protein|uniref:Uncharacterized protein n=1 Tax=Brachymonas denitrificans DSM 15123 TaxID=1121117 RepID=A0A1H8J8A3_9BURK|nr:hypothetical protein [Brachymonas denitrificans]SEN76536.1 hypothetical protein SAMN02745977_01974 [Brachymonas denitrificans DSM 15123]
MNLAYASLPYADLHAAAAPEREEYLHGRPHRLRAMRAVWVCNPESGVMECSWVSHGLRA